MCINTQTLHKSTESYSLNMVLYVFYITVDPFPKQTTHSQIDYKLFIKNGMKISAENAERR